MLIFPDFNDTLILSLKDADPPGLSIDRQGIKHFNTTSHYAGALTPTENMSLHFRDYIDRDVLGDLAKWFRKVYNPKTGAIGWARDYKKQGSLLLLPPGMPSGDAPGVVNSEAYRNRKWICKGSFPVSLKHDPFDNDNSEGVLVTMDLSVDLCYPASMDN